MTDSRLERIIGQLAEFDEQELDIIVKKINKEREDRHQAKINKLKDNFFDTARELENLGYCLYWDEDRIDLNDIYFE